MDLRKIKKLIELVEESGVTELEVSSGDESIRIAMATTGVQAMAPAVSVPVAAPKDAAPASPAQTLKAPMAGVFYQRRTQKLIRLSASASRSTPVMYCASSKA